MDHAAQTPTPAASADVVAQRRDGDRSGPARRTRQRRPRRLRLGLALPSAAILVALSVGVAPALTPGVLPGGTPITVDNTSPVNGDEFNVPGTTIDVTDAGQATIGAGVPITAVYAVDTSGSMNAQRGRRLRRRRRQRHPHGLRPGGRLGGQRDGGRLRIADPADRPGLVRGRRRDARRRPRRGRHPAASWRPPTTATATPCPTSRMRPSPSRPAARRTSRRASRAPSRSSTTRATPTPPTSLLFLSDADDQSVMVGAERQHGGHPGRHDDPHVRPGRRADLRLRRRHRQPRRHRRPLDGGRRQLHRGHRRLGAGRPHLGGHRLDPRVPGDLRRRRRLQRHPGRPTSTSPCRPTATSWPRSPTTRPSWPTWASATTPSACGRPAPTPGAPTRSPSARRSTS